MYNQKNSGEKKSNGMVADLTNTLKQITKHQ